MTSDSDDILQREEGGFVSPTSLSVGTLVEENQLDRRVREVSVEFQRVGLDAGLAEMQSVFNGIVQNRATELVGRIAAAGEQLVLAGAAYRDARSWQYHEGLTASVAGRALTEMVAYFAYGAAHGIINSTARLFAMERRSHELFKQGKNGKPSNNEGFPPFGTKSGHWISFNSNNIDLIRNATSHHPEASSLLEVLEGLNSDKLWTDMISRRHNDFHRWRPQSSGAGVAPESQWHDVSEDTQVLLIYDANLYTPEPLETFVREAGFGLETLTTAMGAWIDQYPAAYDQVLTFALADKFGEEL